MIKGIGTDIIDIRRIEKLLTELGDKFIERIFNPEERVAPDSNKAASHYAKRFAAKEAISKALGSGIGKLSFKDITITNLPSGQPVASIKGHPDAKIHISLSDDYPYASAFAVIEV